MSDRMLLRLFAFPLLLAGGSVVALGFLGWLIPAMLSDISMLSGIAVLSSEFSPWVSSGLWIGSIVIAGVQLHSLWLWSRGDYPSCQKCGGMMSSIRNGRYGNYRRCYSCSQGEKI